MKVKKLELKNQRNSFTLIEALISVAMFMMITTILINIYVVTIRSERIAYTILRDSSVVENVLESTARAIRMGSKFKVINQNTLQFETEEEGEKFLTQFQYVYDDIKGRG